MFLQIVAALGCGLSASLAPQIAQVEYGAYDQSPPAYNQPNASPHVTPVAESNRNEGQHCDQKKRAETNPFLAWCERWQTPINLASTVFLAIFTGVLAVFTVGLWTSGQKHSERELRAYVFPTEIKVGNFKTGRNLVAYIKIENGGQTPAYKLICRSKFIAGPFPQTDFTLSKKDFPDPAVEYLAPHGASWRTARARHLAETANEEAVAVGTHAIYVFGRIDYIDAFKVPRWTTFRSIARGENGFLNHEEGKPEVLALSFDKEGNDAN